MSGTPRQRAFGAFLEQESVILVEYVREKSGFRVLGESRDDGKSATIDQAADRLIALLNGQRVKHASLSVALHQFGAIHHIMALPPAPDAVARQIIRRELARSFGMSDVEFGFTWGEVVSREEIMGPPIPAGAKRVFVGGAPSATLSALAGRLRDSGARVQGVTVVPEAIRRVFDASERSGEPTAVLVCLPSGPHLCFFVDGQLELSIEPPIGLEAQGIVDPSLVLDQLERGAVFLRQQFGGTTVTEVLLSAPANSFAAIKSTIETKMGVRVKQLASELSSPQSVLAIGAVLATTGPAPLDLLPREPTFNDHVQSLLKGPKALAAASVALALLAAAWAAGQVMAIRQSKADIAEYRARIERAVPTVAPMRDAAQQRGAYSKTLETLLSQARDRTALAHGLAVLANGTAPGVNFDSLSVGRSAKGWAGSVAGLVTAGTGGDAMRALDNLYQVVRNQPTFASADLDQVEYAGVSDSVAKAKGGATRPVALQFRLSFTLAPSGVAR